MYPQDPGQEAVKSRLKAVRAEKAKAASRALRRQKARQVAFAASSPSPRRSPRTPRDADLVCFVCVGMLVMDYYFYSSAVT